MIAIAWFVALSVLPQAVDARPLPITIRVLQDVPIRHFPPNLQERRGVLYIALTSQQEGLIKKGQTFQVIKLLQEEQCRIRFEGKDRDLMSCP